MIIKLRSLITEDDDYDPSMDYNVLTKPSPQVVKLTNQIKIDLQPLLSTLRLNNIRIGYIKENGNTLAKYISGTTNNPYIVINVKVLLDSAKQYGINIGKALESTIVHELGHAYLESIGLDTSEHNEDAVEEATREFMDFRDPKDMLNSLKSSYPHLYDKT